MLAVKSMDVRGHFKEWCDKVFSGETLIISRPKNENIVMISETEYNEMMRIKRNVEYLTRIDKVGGIKCRKNNVIFIGRINRNGIREWMKLTGLFIR